MFLMFFYLQIDIFNIYAQNDVVCISFFEK